MGILINRIPDIKFTRLRFKNAHSTSLIRLISKDIHLVFSIDDNDVDDHANVEEDSDVYVIMNLIFLFICLYRY